MLTTRTAVILALWITFILTFLRTLLLQQPLDRRSRLTWTMYFFSILACTFWGAEAEMALDQFFSGLPVALYLKYTCLIAVCHLYRQMLREVIALPPSAFLDYLGPAAIGLGLLSFGVYVLWQPLPLEDLRYIVIGARDAVIVIYILGSFLRDTVVLLREEQVNAMQFKQTAIVLFFLLFSISALGSVSAAIFTLLNVGDAPTAARVLQPVLYPAIFFFALPLIPDDWYTGLSGYRQLARYRRLKRLERRVYRDITAQPIRQPAPWRFVRSRYLETAMYQTVVSILDGYPQMPASAANDRLRACIEQATQQHSDYNALIPVLVRCDDDGSRA